MRPEEMKFKFDALVALDKMSPEIRLEVFAWFCQLCGNHLEWAKAPCNCRRGKPLKTKNLAVSR